MQLLKHSLLLLASPVVGWRVISKQDSGALKLLLSHTMPMALIPAICWYIGVTRQGWDVAGDTMRLTAASAIPMCVLFYLAMIGGVVFLAMMVRWMTATYHDDQANLMAVTASGSEVQASELSHQSSFSAAVRLITFTATPFFLAGLLGLHPVLWVDLLIGTAVATWCIYLLYVGVPSVMDVPPERGFLFASAVLAVALVAFVGLLTVTVLMWEFGTAPAYTY